MLFRSGGNEYGEEHELLESGACIGGRLNPSFKRDSELISSERPALLDDDGGGGGGAAVLR